MVENERKYVLCTENAGALRTHLFALFEQLQAFEIVQGYVTDNVRLRHTIVYADPDKETRMFTFKMEVAGDVIEIETPIVQSDFEKLWLVADRVIRKTRLCVLVDDLTWEVDFFKEPSDDIFMVMAEVELPEGVSEPAGLPPFIADNLLYRVAKNDPRFQNVNLSDIAATKTLLKTL